MSCSLYVHNVTCPDMDSYRTVEDKTYLENVASLCSKAEPYRPVTTHDQLLGGNEKYEPAAKFVDEEAIYYINFFSSEKQLSIDYIHRDQPLVCISVYEMIGSNTYDCKWSWLCKLTAAEYAELFTLLERYGAGEIVY